MEFLDSGGVIPVCVLLSVFLYCGLPMLSLSRCTWGLSFSSSLPVLSVGQDFSVCNSGWFDLSWYTPHSSRGHRKAKTQVEEGGWRGDKSEVWSDSGLSFPPGRVHSMRGTGPGRFKEGGWRELGPQQRLLSPQAEGRG